MKHRRYIAAVLIFSLSLFILNGTEVLGYSDSATRLKSLGIIDVSGKESSIITKGDLVRAISIESGWENDARSSEGETVFPDIKSNSELSGFVNIVVNKGLMVGTSDGKFHPEAKISFAQICTVIVKALGYKDEDLSGIWPKNYISKAKELGITEGVNLSSNDGVPMWAAASMLDKLLDTNIKKANASDADKTYLEKAGLSSESYQYAAIASPIYSKPEVAAGITKDTTRIGNIDLNNSPLIIKNGKSISITDIEDNDVVYQVSDAWSTKRYILVVDNKIQGKITGISPLQVSIDSKSYNYGSGLDYNKITNSYDDLNIGDYATVLLGYDGKAVDFFDIGHQDNSNFAMVVNYSKETSNYKVKLLMIDGITREFYTPSYPVDYKGKLVKFNKTDNNTVVLSSISYGSEGSHTVNKSLRKIDDYYVSHNVKVFNLVNDNTSNTTDAIVEIVKWADVPDGTIGSGKTLYTNKAGSYSDINLIVVNDLLQDKYKTGVITKVTPVTERVNAGVDANGQPITKDKIVSYTYSIGVDGSNKTWKADYDFGFSAGDAVNVLMLNGDISVVNGLKNIACYGYKFDAVDAGRLKINGTSYFVKDNPIVYFCSSDGNYTQKSIKDIEVGKQYRYVTIYIDKAVSNGGKVDTIIVYQ